MHKLKEGDTVTFLFKRKNHQGIIKQINNKKARVWVEGIYDEKTLPLTRLNYVPPIVLTNEQMRKFCRYEIKWSEIIKDNPEYAPVVLENPYTITFNDFLIAIKNIRASGDSNETVRTQ